MWTLFEQTMVMIGFVVHIHCGTPVLDNHRSPGLPDVEGESLTYACIIDVNGARYGTVGELRKLKGGADLEDALDPPKTWYQPLPNESRLLTEKVRIQI